MSELSVEVIVDDSQISVIFDKLQTVFSSEALGPFLSAEIAPYLAKRADDRFSQQGDAAVGHWAALSEATQGFRAVGGFEPTGPINQRTGELKSYVTSGRGNVTSVAEGSELIYPDTASGSVLDKMQSAQMGGPNPSNKRSFPARPVIALDEADSAAVLASLKILVTRAMEL